MGSAAFFDLDKTILSRSSALAFAGPLRRAGLISRRDVTRSAIAQLSLVTGRIDHAAMERIRDRLSVVVTGWDVEQLGRVIDGGLTRIVTPLVFPQALELIQRHRAAGDTVVIITSTGTEMAAPIGALLGVDEVLATRMTVADGRYTGHIADYMYGPRKAEAITQFAADRALDLDACAAYSDSRTDLPMLESVGRPHAVNPDRVLRRVASERGWPIHDFRHPHRRAAGVGISAGLLGFAGLFLMISARRRNVRRGRSVPRR